MENKSHAFAAGLFALLLGLAAILALYWLGGNHDSVSVLHESLPLLHHLNTTVIAATSSAAQHVVVVPARHGQPVVGQLLPDSRAAPTHHDSGARVAAELVAQPLLVGAAALFGLPTGMDLRGTSATKARARVKELLSLMK